MSDLIRTLLNDRSKIIHRDKLTCSWDKAVKALKSHATCFLPYISFLGRNVKDRNKPSQIDAYREENADKYLQCVGSYRKYHFGKPSDIIYTILNVFSETCNPDGERLCEQIQDMLRVGMILYIKNRDTGPRLVKCVSDIIHACGGTVDLNDTFSTVAKKLYEKDSDLFNTLCDIQGFPELDALDEGQRESLTTTIRAMQNELQVACVAEFNEEFHIQQEGSVQDFYGRNIDTVNKILNSEDMHGEPWPYFSQQDIGSSSKRDIVSTKILRSNMAVKTLQALFHSKNRTQLEEFMKQGNVKKDIKMFGILCFLENILPEVYIQIGNLTKSEQLTSKRSSALLQPEYLRKCLERILQLPSISEALAHCLCNILVRINSPLLPKLEMAESAPQQVPQEPQQVLQAPQETKPKRVKIAESKQKNVKDESSFPLMIGAAIIFFMISR